MLAGLSWNLTWFSKFKWQDNLGLCVNLSHQHLRIVCLNEAQGSPTLHGINEQLNLPVILNPACITQAKFIFTRHKGPCQRILECHSTFHAKTQKIHWMFQSTQLQIPTPLWSSKHCGSGISSGGLLCYIFHIYVLCIYFDKKEK